MSFQEINGFRSPAHLFIHGDESPAASSSLRRRKAAGEESGESSSSSSSESSSNKSAYSSMRNKSTSETPSEATVSMDTDVQTRTDSAAKTYIKQLPMECFVEEYRDADFDLKLKNVGTHLRARIQATLDYLEGAVITLIAAVQLVSSKAFYLGLKAVEKIRNRTTAYDVKKFCGATITPAQRWEVLKRAAVGTGHSLYAIASPTRAIASAEKSKYVGTTMTAFEENNFGTTYDRVTRERHHAPSANFWSWGGSYLKA